MRRSFLIAGSTFLLSGTLLFGMVYLAIANYVPQMAGWSDPPGKFSLALDETMLRVPYIISILFMVIGIILFAVAIYKDLTNKNLETHGTTTSRT
ncbi:hypothetical protein J2Z22_001603 [Paenibacillus forsythiae]|uniref:Phosphatase n=1 Tax=Paenibacillus forsythiae TaxID=365616 RepID=A0ABU3H5I6_9BACL|nr:hypothetical protein [Paenibacillus forsythiae]MDT3426083.1 hypothetical protein [Paenibacillus forsythiae]